MTTPTKYLAASVPRSVRTARLSYLPPNAIIGCWFTQIENQLNFIYDVVMLPEVQFTRAKSYLAAPETAIPSLQYGKFSPPYILTDLKTVTVPPEESDPYLYAKTYFLLQFDLLTPNTPVTQEICR